MIFLNKLIIIWYINLFNFRAPYRSDNGNRQCCKDKTYHTYYLECCNDQVKTKGFCSARKFRKSKFEPRNEWSNFELRFKEHSKILAYPLKKN